MRRGGDAPKRRRRHLTPALRVLSLGGGTQSTVMSLLTEQGYFETKPDVAIFADTGWEPVAVYENVEWLKTQVSFPIETISIGRSLGQDVKDGVNARGRPWLTIPVFLSKRDGEPAGMNWRQCTTDYKINPIRSHARQMLGLKARSPVSARTSIEMWLGITTDEAERMRVSPDFWIRNCYPLVDLGMSRQGCIDWFYERYPDRKLPRSACVGCPYRSSAGWLDMRENDPDSFSEAVSIDKLLRSPAHNASSMFRYQAFLHPRRVPLDEAIDEEAKARQGADGSDNQHWGNECAGVCGV